MGYVFFLSEVGGGVEVLEGVVDEGGDGSDLVTDQLESLGHSLCIFK